MVRPKPLKNCVIVLTPDLPRLQQQLKAWIEYAGGRVSSEISEEVTHIVVSSKQWANNTPIGTSESYCLQHSALLTILVVTQARKQYNAYLVKYKWLRNSLETNRTGRDRNKPLSEVDSTYVWEVDHARRVSRRQTERILEQRRLRRAAKTKTAAMSRPCDNDSEPKLESRDKSSDMQDTPVLPAKDASLKLNSKPRKLPEYGM